MYSVRVCFIVSAAHDARTPAPPLGMECFDDCCPDGSGRVSLNDLLDRLQEAAAHVSENERIDAKVRPVSASANIEGRERRVGKTIALFF